MSHNQAEQAIITNTRVSIEDMNDLATVGAELTDEELALVAGARPPVYIGKTYFSDTDTWEPDWLA